MQKKLEEAALENEQSAVAIARLVLANAAALRPVHVTELLSVAIWKYTEARGKYNTRYATPASMMNGAKVRHEHVIPRKTIRIALLEQPDRIEHIMSLAIACLVTHEEHQLLNGAHFGWVRYQMAGLTVVDRSTGKAADLDGLSSALIAAWAKALRNS